MFGRKISATGILLLFFVVIMSFNVNAQGTTIILGQDTDRRPISTAVPFLSIAPDARSAAMGDVGVALSPDANSTYWNAAKLPFAKDKFGISLSYSPWLRQLVNDMYLAYLSGYYKLDDRQAVGFALTYFNLGDIQFTDIIGNPIKDFNPREFAFSGSYARKLGEQFSLAVSGRFIYSNLSANIVLPNQQEAKAGITGAVDIGAYYTKDDLEVGGRPASLSLGVNISNIGAKISYSNENEQDFIPTNLRLGGAFTMDLDPLSRNALTFALDFNKLMVPTPPKLDSAGNIIDGTDPRDKTVLSGIFGSFSDAPDGFSEELQEFTTSIGVEYKYRDQQGRDVFAARAGYFNEHKNKGDRKYFTVGAGINYRQFGLDVAYLIPQSQSNNNPLAETLRFTLSLNFEDKTESASE